MAHGVRFAAGTIVSPGEYRNTETNEVRYFDGSTPLPGGVNSASWQQVSDHYRPSDTAQRQTRESGAHHPVRFAPGALVSAGEYRNTATNEVRFFDGKTPVPGGVNAASWVQVSDHFHATEASHMQTRESGPHHPVRFAAGALVSAGEYRNTVTGEVRFFDGNTPLPGGVNAASWQQVSDHYHAEAPATGQ